VEIPVGSSDGFRRTGQVHGREICWELLSITTSRESPLVTNHWRLKSYSRQSITCTCPVLLPLHRLLLLAHGLAGLLVWPQDSYSNICKKSRWRHLTFYTYRYEQYIQVWYFISTICEQLILITEEEFLQKSSCRGTAIKEMYCWEVIKMLNTVFPVRIQLLTLKQQNLYANSEKTTFWIVKVAIRNEW